MMDLKQLRKLAQKHGYNIQTYWRLKWRYRLVEYKDGYDMLPVTGYHNKEDIIDILQSVINDSYTAVK